jgi:hypothetical protein
MHYDSANVVIYLCNTTANASANSAKPLFTTANEQPKRIARKTKIHKNISSTKLLFCLNCNKSRLLTRLANQNNLKMHFKKCAEDPCAENPCGHSVRMCKCAENGRSVRKIHVWIICTDFFVRCIRSYCLILQMNEIVFILSHDG